MTKKNTSLRLTKADALVQDIRSMIEQARGHVARSVNVGTTSLYWHIGRRIQQEVLKGKRADYGKRIVATLSQQLSWSHFVEILPLKEPLKRDFYSEMCRVENWNVRTRKRIWKLAYFVRWNRLFWN